MAGQNRPAQIIEPAPAVLAAVLLPLGLRRIPTLLADRGRGTVHAAHPIGPTQGTDRLETFGVVDEILDVQHGTHWRATSKGPAVYPHHPPCAESSALYGPFLDAVGNCLECIKSLKLNPQGGGESG